MTAKMLRLPVIPPYQPYTWDDASGQWQGIAPRMGRDVAKDPHVGVDYVVTAPATIVPDLQGTKCDTYFAFAATPERALAIDRAGPIHTLGVIVIDRHSWNPTGDKLTDFNQPNIYIYYVPEVSQQQRLKRFGPNATPVRLQTVDHRLLAVRSARADTYLSATLGELVPRQKSSHVGDIVFRQTRNVSPPYAGLRTESDGWRQNSMQRWAEYNRANGNVAEWLIAALAKNGLEPLSIPSGIQF